MILLSVSDRTSYIMPEMRCPLTQKIAIAKTNQISNRDRRYSHPTSSRWVQYENINPVEVSIPLNLFL
ncbi:MAG: hypothetical protein F6K14_29765 [Symploca sp. SIO2C1]|nr:hypothetical protein [Symploca sp. SIO2C1]